MKKLLTFLITIVVATASHALTIDSEKYFAYFYVESFKGSSGYYILLSHESCDIDIGETDNKWQKAVYQGLYGFPPTKACWMDYSGKDQSKIEKRFLSYWGSELLVELLICQCDHPACCRPVSKSEFIDTSTLPRQADF